MPQFLVTTNHHRPPPSATAICSSLTSFRPSLSTSIRFSKTNAAAAAVSASVGYTLVSSPYQITISSKRNSVVICMAKERRVKMVAKQIQRELSDMLLTDQVLQYAILPEAALGADLYLSSLTTISDVEVSSDLQVVKVYVSVFGDDRGKEVAISGLKSKAKYVRGQLGKRMKLRLTPEIRFIEDESLERGSRVIAILDKIKNEKTTESQNGDEDESFDPNNDNGDWDDDDPEEEIIYVK